MSNVDNWVDRAQLELERKRHTQDIQKSEAERLNDVQGARDAWAEEYKKASDSYKEIMGRVKDPDNPLYNSSQEVEAVRQWKDSAANRLNEADIKNAELYAYNYPGGVAREEAPTIEPQRGVESSEFLRERVPGLGAFIPGTGNIPGTAPKVRTPTMNWWRTTPQAQQRELAGYAQFTGEDFSDIYTRTQNMLPQRLTLGRNWRAVSQ